MAMCLGSVFFWLKPEHICVHGHTRARACTHTHRAGNRSHLSSYVTRLSELQLPGRTVQGEMEVEKTRKQTQRRRQGLACLRRPGRGAGRRGGEVCVRGNERWFGG